MNFEEGQEYSICIKALYESEDGLTFGNIVPDYDEHGNLNYYDLYNEDGEFACCDGEVSRVDQVGEVLITFVNDEGESAVRFALTKDEAKIACFSYAV